MKRSSRRFLVAHPGRQHSHQLALALQEAGLLGLYIHGSLLPEAARSAIPRRRRFMFPLVPIGRRITRRLFSLRHRAEMDYRLDRLFDYITAAILSVSSFDAVVVYENAALQTLKVAKKSGRESILDVAGVYHTTQDRWIAYAESPEFHSFVTRSKDMELGLADLVVCCSAQAMKEFPGSLTSISRFRDVPLGCDVHLFRNGEQPIASDSAPRFLFVGHATRTKGIDILVEVAKDFIGQNRRLDLTIVSDLKNFTAREKREAQSVANLVSPVGHAELVKLYQSHDCLVVPSRFDAYAMVVPEALACGAFVIVTSNVGASALIKNGHNGIVIEPGSKSALANAIAEASHDIYAIRGRRPKIASDGANFDWKYYRKRLIDVVNDMHKRLVDSMPLGCRDA